MAEAVSGRGTLDEYAAAIDAANKELQVQTAYFETIRRACQALAVYEQDNSKPPIGLPVITIRDVHNPDDPGIEIDLDTIGPESALTIKPFLEMAAGAVGVGLQQSWGRIHQVNTNAQQILQAANRVQQG
jgi:hypothetical protein